MTALVVMLVFGFILGFFAAAEMWYSGRKPKSHVWVKPHRTHPEIVEVLVRVGSEWYFVDHIRIKDPEFDERLTTARMDVHPPQRRRDHAPLLSSVRQH